jgi:hypothetical protein
MKKNMYALIALAFISINANALIYYVDGSKTDDSGNSFSWGTAKKTIGAVLNLSLTASDTIFVKSGTYSYSASSGNALNTLGTKFVNLYGGFAGTETKTVQRAKSDKDGNGIIEPWEFTNETILSFNLTDAIGLGLFSYYTSNPSTTPNIFDGFTVTGTLTNTIATSGGGKSAIAIYGNWIFRNNTVRNWNITTNLNAVGAYAEGALVKLYSGNNGGTPTPTQFANNIVDNCLFEKNTSTVTSNATPNTDLRQAPFVRMVGSATGDLGRNLLKNSVIRNNKATIDYSASSITVNANTRGFMVDFTPGVSSTVLKNNIIHNNDAEFVCKTGSNYSATQCGLIGVTPSNNTQTDSVMNNTIANNKLTKLSAALAISNYSSTVPYHKVINNAVFNNTNYDGSSTAQANISVYNAPNNTQAGMLIFNNVCSGGTTNLTNNASNTASTNIYGNVTDLAATNAGANAPYFNAPTSLIGTSRVTGSDSTAIAQSYWKINSQSYLIAKGIASTNTTDKAGTLFNTSSPSVGAYEEVGIATNNPSYSENKLVKVKGHAIYVDINSAIEVYDTMGKLVIPKTVQNPVILNQSGLFIVKFTLDNVLIVQKIILY